MKPLRIATTNQHKLREFRQMLTPLGFEIRGVDDLDDFDVVEDGDTFAANAIKKAAALLARTGEPAIADDSGLVVDALGGAPGVYSSRFAGVEPPAHDAANRKKLLAELAPIPDEERTARFVCALAYCAPGQEPQVFIGTLAGRIGHEERGENGFGYDSIFIVEGDTRTSAELSPAEKNRISHRGRALDCLIERLGFVADTA